MGLFFLTKGGDWLSDYCSIFAEKLGIPPIIVGLTIVSVATETIVNPTIMGGIPSFSAKIEQ